jgi:acyl carrier protein
MYCLSSGIRLAEFVRRKNVQSKDGYQAPVEEGEDWKLPAHIKVHDVQYRDRVEERVTGIIADVLGYPVDEIEPGKYLIDDLGVDSLDVVEIAMAMEDLYGIDIQDEALEGWRTVNSIVNYMSERRSGVKERVVDIIADILEIEPNRVKYGSDLHLRDNLGADSLGIVEIVESLEKEFGFKVPEEDMQGWGPVDGVIEYALGQHVGLFNTSSSQEA